MHFAATTQNGTRSLAYLIAVATSFRFMILVMVLALTSQ